MIDPARRRLIQQGLGLLGLGLGSGCASRSFPWQVTAEVRRIARLVPSGLGEITPAGTTSAFREGLRDLGYREGENLLTDERSFDGADRVADVAADVLDRRPEVIVVPSAVDARTVQTLTRTIPIVSAGNGDLVASGVVASQARPEGNVTGLSTPVLGSKQLQLLQEAVPGLERVAALFDTTTGTYQGEAGRAPYQAAARSLNLQLVFIGARGVDDLGPAFDQIGQAQADGLLVLNGPVTTVYQTRIAELALQQRLPSLWQQHDAPGRGGLLAYGPNRADLFRRAATYVDKLLKGARPADLPIEQPTKFDFILNLTTATALGLTIPPWVLQQATEVIP